MNNIDINSTNENSLFHFIKRNSYELIENNGLKSYYSNNPIEVSSTCILTFAKGKLGLLYMCDSWIKTIVYQVGLDNYLKSMRKLEATEYIILKENFNRLFNEGKMYTSNNVNESFNFFTNYIEDDLLLVVDNNEDILISKELKYSTPLYDEEVFDMDGIHFVTGIFKNESKENISIVCNENNDNVFNILNEIYEEEKEKNPNLSFEFLDKYIVEEKTKRLELEMKRSV